MSSGVYLTDFPAEKDLLGYQSYATLLADLLTDPSSQTPLTAAILGPWGAGKSTVLQLLRQHLENRKSNQYTRCVVVPFNPWVHRREPNMLIPLLHALRDSFRESGFIASAKKIGNVLTRVAADVAVKGMTAGSVSVEQLEKVEKQYLETRDKATSEIRSLRNTLQLQANRIAEKGSRLVLIIDDLDRCEPDAIVDLLEGIKIFFDVEHLFTILAMDKQVVDRGITLKYGKLGVPDDQAKKMSIEYLDKLIQLPIYLPPISPDTARAFIHIKAKESGFCNQAELLSKLLMPNPRTTIRVLNLLVLRNRCVDRGTVGQKVHEDSLTRLAVLQLQYPDFFAEVELCPLALIAFELVHRKTLGLNDHKAFATYGSRVLQICTKYYEPGSSLAEVFTGSMFEKIGDTRISKYVQAFA